MMHRSVMDWAVTVLTPELVRDKDVLEVGSLDMNGSLRPAVTRLGPASYHGIDIRPGPGVDQVLPAEMLHLDCADLLISTEMLEHAQHWSTDLDGMVRALRPGGVILLTCRGPGYPRHEAPGDWWRFTPELLADVLAGWHNLQLLQLLPDPEAPGVFALARRPGRGEPSHLFPVPAPA
jgi:hypothetical protein